ncbi:MAG: hypothetical protein Q8Q86_00465, partial [Candidatus Daviesbacteria bacterium]|nr:hypothetical protein [Candidatus Daviesbacteria bacterium]
MSQKGFINILVILVVLAVAGVGGYYLISRENGQNISETTNRQSQNQDQTDTRKQYEIIRKLDQDENVLLELSFKDLNTGYIHKVVNAPRTAALGDDFAVWVADAGNPMAKKSEFSGFALEFDVWKYDFKTKQETLLLERLDNNLNHSDVPIAVSERKAVLSTFKNRLIFIDVDTKQVVEIPMVDNYTINNDTINIIKGNVIVPAWVTGTYITDTLFAYNMIKQTFSKVYHAPSGYAISNGSVTTTDDGRLHW